MKISKFRGLVLFSAGALSAAVVAIAGEYWVSDQPMTAKEWEIKAHEALVLVSDLGSRVAKLEKLSLEMNEGPPIKCVWPPIITSPPPPPVGQAVDPKFLKIGAAALTALNNGYIKQVKEPVKGVNKCWEEPDARR